MTDTEPPVTPARSANMSKVRGKNTKPEMAVRRAAHALGLRFRLHRRDLPGTPDLVFAKRKTAIFVHGCFWHRHEGCRKAGPAPKTRTAFWQAKFDRNTARDARNADALIEAGWNVATIWECETRPPEKLTDQLRSIFNIPDRVAGNDP
ncbi:very short patch repair endonuclease [Sphingomonas melonis]|jgi:DNA mismatch endonuclease (patch repair protein)